MIGVMIIPTGLGCTIGGDAGDALPAVKLIAACCDKLITHPNAVNASDINEMPENVLYVDGAMLDRFLERKIRLKEVKQNRILVVCNEITPDTMNAVNAARHTIGAHIVAVTQLETPLEMIARKDDEGRATGTVKGVDDLVAQLRRGTLPRFDAVAIHTPIDVEREVILDYMNNGGVNPWGGVEAKACRMISNALINVDWPIAHAPTWNVTPEDPELYFFNHRADVPPRQAAEHISDHYLHCVLKGLNRAPRPIFGPRGIEAYDVDFLISPWMPDGRPHEAAKQAKIPVVYVRENRTVITPEPMTVKGERVENYLEAAGWIQALKAGVLPRLTCADQP